MAIFGDLSPHPKIPFPAAGLGTKSGRPCSVIPRLRRGNWGIFGRRGNYSGLSPSASNCRLHSVGGSRSRSMPMPRGKRPSTAALTRLVARKASEMVILTCRTLHFSRVQRSATVVARRSYEGRRRCFLLPHRHRQGRPRRTQPNTWYLPQSGGGWELIFKTEIGRLGGK